MTNEMTIKEIYDNLNLMGFEVTLENLAKMKPTELKRFHKKARKAFESFYSVQRVASQPYIIQVSASIATTGRMAPATIC